MTEELNVTVKSLAQQNDLTLEDFIKFVEERGDSDARLIEEVKKNLKITTVQHRKHTK
jgi:SurA N-terminal domain.